MTVATIDMAALPRAAGLTSALTSPPDATVSHTDLLEVRLRLEQELGRLTSGLSLDQRIRIDSYQLRPPPPETPEERPFAWSPLTARRQLGLECVRAWLGRQDLVPVRASELAIARLLRRAEDDSRPGGMAMWLAGLSPGALAVVRAEAVTWATQLIHALEWAKLARPVVGDDHSIQFEAVPQFLLRSRGDVVSTLADQAATGGGPRRLSNAVFVVMTGRPLSTARDELGLAALGAALDPRSRAVPARVVGWWPQCGRSMVLPVTASVLEMTTDAVLEATKRAIAAAPRAVPAEQTAGAARRSRRVARQPDANPVIERIAS